MPRDLTSKRLIIFKGLLFGALALVTAGIILAEYPTARLALLLAILVWSSARFYYFLFYVMHAYVDPNLKYSGVGAMVTALLRKKPPTPGAGSPCAGPQ
jgi:hypothetical protein